MMDPWPCILLLLPALGCWRDIPGLWPTAGVIVYPWPACCYTFYGWGAEWTLVPGPASCMIHEVHARCCWLLLPGPTALCWACGLALGPRGRMAVRWRGIPGPSGPGCDES